MNDWKELAPYFKQFFNTLAGKLTAGAAFALLTLLALAWFGAGIPRERPDPENHFTHPADSQSSPRRPRQTEIRLASCRLSPTHHRQSPLPQSPHCLHRLAGRQIPSRNAPIYAQRRPARRGARQ